MCEIVAVPAGLERSTEVVLVHIIERVVAGVVHNDIHNNSDTVLVSCINKSLEFFLCTEVLIALSIVENIIAVV